MGDIKAGLSSWSGNSLFDARTCEPKSFLGTMRLKDGTTERTMSFLSGLDFQKVGCERKIIRLRWSNSKMARIFSHILLIEGILPDI